MSDVSVMRDVIVVGGGCYGTFYGGQLAKAREKGRARFRRVVIVDRDPACRARRDLGDAADRVFVVSEWAAYFDAYLGAAAPADPGAPADYIVPSPLMPHLMFQWVFRRARARWPERAVAVDPIPLALGTPYERSVAAPDNTRYVSFADWICPTHCVEPATCPATGGPRDWEMSRAVTELTTRLHAADASVSGPALFQCRHQVYGVGAFAVDEVLAGDALVSAAGGAGGAAAVVIATISSCHGAVNLLRIGAPAGHRPPPPFTALHRPSPLLTPLTSSERHAALIRARDLFNAGAYWEAHEALETVWRSIITEDEARVWQGFIQAAAALLHRSRGNAHGVQVVGQGALEKLAGPARPDVEFDTITFRARLARALTGEGDPPRLEFRTDA